jgi:DNA-binding transcriptional regulator YdaS (Cro superfamily)
MRRNLTLSWSSLFRRLNIPIIPALIVVAIAMPVLYWPLGTTAMAATKLPAIDAALAAQVSDQVHRDWNPDAELIQISATTTVDGSADASQSRTPISFLFRANGRGYQMTISDYGAFVGSPAILPRTANAALPIQFISLKDALGLARAKGFSQTGSLHPVIQSQTSLDGLQRIGWLFAADGDPTSKQIFVSAEGHQVGSVQQLFGSLRQ